MSSIANAFFCHLLSVIALLEHYLLSWLQFWNYGKSFRRHILKISIASMSIDCGQNAKFWYLSVVLSNFNFVIISPLYSEYFTTSVSVWMIEWLLLSIVLSPTVTVEKHIDSFLISWKPSVLGMFEIQCDRGNLHTILPYFIIFHRKNFHPKEKLIQSGVLLFSILSIPVDPPLSRKKTLTIVKTSSFLPSFYYIFSRIFQVKVDISMECLMS